MKIPVKKISRHMFHYLPLVGIFTATVLGFSLFSYDRNFQLALGISAAFGYVAWGLVHHHIHRDLYASIILEYLAVACLGVVILFFILFRA